MPALWDEPRRRHPRPRRVPSRSRTIPARLNPGQVSALQFFVHDPWKDRPVGSYNVVHEKLFHAFVVSEDLQFFVHGHPTFVADGVFQLPIVLPKAGMYRVLGDFYPAGATPQLTAQTLFVPGEAPAAVQLSRDYSEKTSDNMRVMLETIPEQAIAGMRTQLRFRIAPGDGLEKYLGAWAHMLAASNDLIDMIHQHPYRVDTGRWSNSKWYFRGPRCTGCGCSFSGSASSTPSNSTCP